MITERSEHQLIIQLCEHQPEAIAWFTPVMDETSASILDFEVQFCNQACCDKKGAPRELILGQRVLRDGFPDPSIKEIKFDQLLTVYKTGQPLQYAYFSTWFEKYFQLSRVKVADGILVTSRDLTDLYMANEELRLKAVENQLQRDHFHKILNGSADGIVALAAIRDPEGKITDFRVTSCNRAARRLGGFPEDAVGMNLLDIHPQLVDLGYFDFHKKVVETGIPMKLELPFAFNGQEGWFIVSLQKLDDGLISNFTDVTDVRKIESVATQNAKELDALFQTSNVAMYIAEAIKDDDGNAVDMQFLRVNNTFLKLLNYEEDFVLNNTVLKISPYASTKDFIRSLDHVLKTGNPLQTTIHYPHSNRWFEYSMVKIDENKVSAAFSDISGLKLKELELEKTVEALKKSNESLEEFTRAASHDLKEPIRKIMFFGDRLRAQLDEKLAAEQVDLLERMNKACQRMKLLIDDLLEYAQVNMHGREKEYVDLNLKMKLILSDLEIQVKEKDADIEIGDLPVVKGYRRQLQQLFQNLISNALKYQHAGRKPVIKISSRRVKGNASGFDMSTAEGKKEFYLIEVADNGIGFSQEDAERIFNVFTRLHGNNEFSGTGVGLSIVRKVADNHKGYVRAMGKPGEGATFQVLFPVK